MSPNSPFLSLAGLQAKTCSLFRASFLSWSWGWGLGGRGGGEAECLYPSRKHAGCIAINLEVISTGSMEAWSGGGKGVGSREEQAKDLGN